MNSAAFLDWILTLELWWVSLGLFATSIGLALEVYGRFSEAVRDIEGRRLKQVRIKMREAIAKARKTEIEEVEEEIFGMRAEYAVASEPRRMLTWSVDYYFLASALFMGSVLVRAGIDYGWLVQPVHGPAEGVLFAFALILFSVATVTIYQVMRLVDRETSD